MILVGEIRSGKNIVVGGNAAPTTGGPLDENHPDSFPNGFFASLEVILPPSLNGELWNK